MPACAACLLAAATAALGAPSHHARKQRCAARTHARHAATLGPGRGLAAVLAASRRCPARGGNRPQRVASHPGVPTGSPAGTGAASPQAGTPVSTPPLSPGLGAPIQAPQEETNTAPPAVTHVQVAAVEYHFTLSRTTVPAGKVVFDFVNNGQDEHNLNLLSGEGSLAGSFPNTPSKGVREQTIEMRSGDYTLFCSLPEHEAKGMHATLTVE